MSSISQIPAYNLKAVLKETGLKPDVLRAWERRYKLPKPQRTPGGHRLYSQHDIETLKWLRARQVEGFSISRAVELWKDIMDKGSDPLVEYLPASLPVIPDRQPVADARIEILRQNWLEASLAFDGNRADEILNQAFAIYPIETVCLDILQRALSEIGDYWYLDKITAQQEHFATTQASRRLEALIAAAPRPTRQQTILVGNPPGEWHTFSIQLLSLFLLRRGLKVVYLGANIPIEQLEETAAAIRPDLIVLAAQQLSTAATLHAVALTLQKEGIPLAYGGLIFNRIPRLRQRISGHFLGETLDEAIYMIEKLAVAAVPVLHPTRDLAACQQLARQYEEKRPLIEIRLFDMLQKIGLHPEIIGEANNFFGNGLSAALELGDPAFLEADLKWVSGLLTRTRIPTQMLMHYLVASKQAIQSQMGSASDPIIAWISSYITRSETARYTNPEENRSDLVF